MSATSEPMGTLQVALAHARRLLEADPAAAAEQAREILKVAVDHPVATALLGLALGSMGQGDAALATLRRAVAAKPDQPDAWRAIGDHLTAIGDAVGADEAYAQHVRYSTRDPRLMEAAVHLCENRIAPAEALLRAHLKQHPTDVAAIRMLAEIAARLGRYGDAENLLARALELAPSFDPARHNYAVVLHRQNKPEQALREVERLLAATPRNPSFRNLKAAVLSRIGEYDAAIDLYAGVLKEYPQNAKVWMSYGHALKTAGRQDESIKAYRESIDRAANLGEAWWSLANLKTVRFDAADIATMRAQLASERLSPEDRFHFHFALGKALEDAGDYAASFEHYARGNELRRAMAPYSAQENHAHVQRSKAVFTREFFASRRDQGCPAPDPIFVVGLPRSGSTLVEQILASHPLVEGTMELPDLVSIARSLSGRRSKGEPANASTRYPDILAELSPDRLRSLGELYLQQTRIQRKTDAPYFIDKLPNNWAHTGLIHLILPHAKIIDARRHPLGCCFSGYKQHFARGQTFTYSLDDLGRYYRDYVELMAHFDAVLPGRVHRVIYERMVADTDAEVHRLLEYCGLPFDERCLRFYENERAVRTASSEQVRRPIYREAVDHWRNYEPWLDPLKSALGDVLQAYPQAPEFPSAKS
jgi:tetratricopeptide (TPR) repeat protein